MNFSVIKKHLNEKPMCIVPAGDDSFNKALCDYLNKKGFHYTEYKGSFYIAKEIKQG